ncbi:hypothetical protein ABIA03_003739 [Bradyrhizobium yuanmingense]|uniref:Uncharacterized protein n=1 Tax=Bradyrhizobium yuanmingense TaxID=108015 RepID=A0ABV4GEK2_9BRAD
MRGQRAVWSQLSKRRNRKDTDRNASGPSGKTPPLPRSPRQSLPANIFHFTEIRNCGIHRSSRPRERGDRTSSRTRARVRWTRLRRARGAGPGRDEPREVSQRAERTAPTSGEASWRSRKLRTAKPCGPDRRCYGQALRRCIWARPGPEASSIREVTEARRNSAPGRAGISRQTTAQGRPCVGLHLYAAVQFSACAFAQRTVGASRHPAFPAPSLQRGTRKPAKLGRFGPRECRAMCGRLAKRPNLLASPMSLGYQRRAAIAVSSSLTPGPRSATPIAARAGRCSAVK